MGEEGGEEEEEDGRGEMTTSLSELALEVMKESKAHAVVIIANATRGGRRGMGSGGSGRQEPRQTRRTIENKVVGCGIGRAMGATGGAVRRLRFLLQAALAGEEGGEGT